jgi:uncharacterized protein YdhG (YjbR/CyaY superfamily)
MNTVKAKNTGEYIASFPANVQKILESLRATIQKAAPKAVEIISYNMPAFKQHGVLVYFAGNKNHIGFYPTSSPIRIFKNELINYKTSKGAIQFPIDQAIPTRLVTKIVKYRVAEDKEKNLLKTKKSVSKKRVKTWSKD